MPFCGRAGISRSGAPTVVALATIRDIEEGKELCIDYNPDHDEQEEFNAHMTNDRRVPCKCGAGAGVCRGWVF